MYEIITQPIQANTQEHQVVKKYYDGTMEIQSEITVNKDFNITLGGGFYRTTTIQFQDYFVPFINSSIFYDDFESRPAVTWYIKNVDWNPQSANYWVSEWLPQYRGAEDHPPRICVCSNFQITQEIAVRVGYIAKGWWKENSIVTKCLQLANQYYQEHWTKYGTFNFKFYEANSTNYRVALLNETGKIDGFVNIQKSNWSVTGSADFE